MLQTVDNEHLSTYQNMYCMTGHQWEPKQREISSHFGHSEMKVIIKSTTMKDKRIIIIIFITPWNNTKPATHKSQGHREDKVAGMQIHHLININTNTEDMVKIALHVLISRQHSQGQNNITQNTS